MDERPGIHFTRPVAISVVLVTILAIYCVARVGLVLFIKHFW